MRKKPWAIFILLALLVPLGSGRLQWVPKLPRKGHATGVLKATQPPQDSLTRLSLQVLVQQQDFGLPAMHTKDSQQLVRHAGYTLVYRPRYRQAAWVAYKLTHNGLAVHHTRTNDFRPDPAVPGGTPTPQDYVGSGYDRGHLAPAADMATTAQQESESFYMSNMSPQAPALNRGIWAELEGAVRRWANQAGTLYVVTGPIFKEPMRRIGHPARIAVPPAYYKVVLDVQPPGLHGIAFILPNRGSHAPLQSFACTIDQVEKATGLNFFPLLPDSLERRLEGSYSLQAWPFPRPALSPAPRVHTAGVRAARH